MCIACIEYTKDKLTLNEFSSALREMSLDDKLHAEEVASLIQKYANDPKELKKRLDELEKKSRD